jgi:hypothetical protein
MVTALTSANGPNFFTTQLFGEVGVGENFVMDSLCIGACAIQVIDNITLHGHLAILRSPVQKS